ncbi:hypothetical protein CR513_54663, partial [Mucuna pruriens]
MSNDHEKPQSLATEKEKEKGYPTYWYHPKGSAITQSKLNAAQPQSPHYANLQDPQLPSKNHLLSRVPSPQFPATAPPSLCPRPIWSIFLLLLPKFN